MKFTPLHDRVLVRRIEGEEKTKGGLIIPDTAKEKPSEGEVISVGPGARKDSGELIEPSVKAGDRILFGKWSGTEVKIDGEELLIMKESDVMGVIDQTVTLKKGKATITVRGQAKGRKAYTVVYVGSAKVTSASKSVKVRVR